MKKFLFLLFLVPALAPASEDGIALDAAPVRTDALSLQDGARTFVNYCLNCHGAASMRYNRLQDLGLSETEIKDNLMFASAKIGETMKVPLTMKDGREWFGVAPPDLSVIARARGADWLYTYLRSFYRDQVRPTGWNNTAFPNVGMPHVLYELQGQRGLKVEKIAEHGRQTEKASFVQLTQGTLTAAGYDEAVANLVGFLVYVGEPNAAERKRLGIYVLFVLLLLTVLTWLLKREFWKDVH
jgi:ubiquinol-cytochrome c reductase cytochrome c1 subunit